MGVMKDIRTRQTMGSARASGAIGGNVQIFGAEAHVFFDRQTVIRAMKPKRLKFLRHWAGFTRKVARGSIKRKGWARKAPKQKYKKGTRTWTRAYARWRQEVRKRRPSAPGSPPHTWSDLLKSSILFAYDQGSERAVVGPSAQIIGEIGQLHEFGGQRHGRHYPARPFMAPAGKKAVQSWPKIWAQATN